jgi:hypothetical protein
MNRMVRYFAQAGDHPWGLTTTIELNSEEVTATGGTKPAIVPAGDPKDISASLPPGLLGDPKAVSRCS